MTASPQISSVADVEAGLADNDYLADTGLATAIFLAMSLRRPLLLEGDPGVGKTEVAKTIAAWLGTRMIRLQCYEGLDASQAVYEWDYSRQLLHLRTAEVQGVGGEHLEDELYSERFLVKRPLLEAIAHGGEVPPVLLIDEVDRADDEFEAFLLEVLSEYSITVPELGSFVATVPPVVIITSNRTRDVHDALKRRSLYHWVEHPDFAREVEIIRRRTEGVSDRLAKLVAAAVEQFRHLGLYKPPGVAESIDWSQALHRLGAEQLTPELVDASLGTVLKYREDIQRVRDHGVEDIVEAATARVP